LTRSADLVINLNEPWVGLYLPDDYHSASQKALRYQRLLGERVQVLSFYIAWGPGFEPPPLAGLKEIQKNGFIPMITFEPWSRPEDYKAPRPEDQPEFSLTRILSGKYDDYIRHWAFELGKIPAPIFFRPMHEMNGNWYPWAGCVNGNRPEDFIETWRYLRSIFREALCDNLSWVWAPYAHSVPDEPGNEMGLYFPGVQEVDWLGLDGYNWGTNREWSRWESFPTIFAEGYERLTALAPEKPYMIAEMGCAEKGGSKPEWIAEAFEALSNRFTRIKALILFNVDKECDWRLESSEKSFASFKTQMTRWLR
jgi:beta-mannanase